MRAISRYSFTCNGELCSQARNAPLSSAVSAPAWLAMNHSPACSAITARISSSSGIMDSLSSCHGVPTAGECLREILLHHAGRHPHMIGDLLIGEAVSALENDRRA